MSIISPSLRCEISLASGSVHMNGFMVVTVHTPSRLERARAPRYSRSKPNFSWSRVDYDKTQVVIEPLLLELLGRWLRAEQVGTLSLHRRISESIFGVEASSAVTYLDSGGRTIGMRGSYTGRAEYALCRRITEDELCRLGALARMSSE